MFRIKTGVSHVLLATRTNSLQNETSIYKQDNQVENWMETKNKLVDAIVKGIQEKKGQDITIADLRALDGSIANYFVICQGN